MFYFSLEEIATIIGGTVYQPSGRQITGFSIDTRTLSPGNIFWTLKGERFDGYDFIHDAWNKGASAAIVSHYPSNFPGTYIFVEDTLKALQNLAATYRQHLNIPIIAITGSHGKTTTKDMTSAVLKTRFHTHETHFNLNGLIGVPLTVLGISQNTEIAVIEIGISKPGEMSLLANIVRPTIGVLTCISESHTEYLKNRETIFKEKSILFDYLYNNESLSFLNADDEFVQRLISDGKCLTFGFRNGAFKARVLTTDKIKTTFILTEPNGEQWTYTIPLPGKHNVLNATIAIAIGRKFGLQHKTIQSGLDLIKLSPNRSEVCQIGNITIINDAYNAAPKSMYNSLKMLKELSGYHRSVAIIGDMLELGSLSRSAHEHLGNVIKSLEIDMTICFGSEIQYTYNVLKAGGADVYHFNSVEEIVSFYISHAQSNDVVLVKASRALKAENIADQLFLKLREIISSTTHD